MSKPTDVPGDPQAATLEDVLGAVRAMAGTVGDLKDKLVAQAEFMDGLDSRLASLETAPLAAPPPSVGAGLALPEDVASQLMQMQAAMKELEDRPVGALTAEQQKQLYEKELKRTAEKLKKQDHRQMYHSDPDWCLAQTPPEPLVRNVVGAAAQQEALSAGYYPSLRAAATASAHAGAVKVAQDAAEAELRRSTPKCTEAQVTNARRVAGEGVKAPSAAAVLARQTAIHKAVGRIGHEGWSTATRVA